MKDYLAGLPVEANGEHSSQGDPSQIPLSFTIVRICGTSCSPSTTMTVASHGKNTLADDEKTYEGRYPSSPSASHATPFLKHLQAVILPLFSLKVFVIVLTIQYSVDWQGEEIKERW